MGSQKTLGPEGAVELQLFFQEEDGRKLQGGARASFGLRTLHVCSSKGGGMGYGEDGQS